MSLPDIGKVQLLGEQEEQVVIAFSPPKMASMGVTLQQITSALKAQNAIAPAGTARTDKENIALRVSGAFTSEESLKTITLHVDDRFIPLTDIATLSRETAEPPTPLFRVNGQPAIGLAVSMASTGNMLRFGQALNGRMENVRHTLPHGIDMTRVADQSEVVKHAVVSPNWWWWQKTWPRETCCNGKLAKFFRASSAISLPGSIRWSWDLPWVGQ